MNLQLIEGKFSSNDAIEIIAQMVHIQIKYYENKTSNNSNEDDLKKKEIKINQLQKKLYELQKTISSNNNSVRLEAIIKLV